MNCNTTHYRANSSSVPGDPTDSDTFDGATGAAPNPTVWTRSPANSTYTLGSGRLRVNVSSGGNQELQWGGQFAGDFDATIDVRSLSSSLGLGGSASLSLVATEVFGGTPLVARVGRDDSSTLLILNSQTFVAATTGAVGGSRTSSRTTPPLVLRIARTGTVVRVYDGNGTTQLHQVDLGRTSPFRIAIRATSTGGLTATLDDFGVTAAAGTFVASGSYESPVFDLGAASLQTVRHGLGAAIGSGGTVALQVAAATSAAGPFTYLGPDGTAGTSFTTAGVAAAVPGALAGKPFVRFRAVLAGASASSTPTLESVALAALAPARTAPGFASPAGVFEAETALLVADAANHRVLAFPLPLVASSEPDRAIGQPSLDALSPGTGAGALRQPAGGAAASGLVAISDAGNHRVILASDADLADERLVGQASFEARIMNHALVDAAHAARPLGVAAGALSGGRHRLAVADAGTGRVLVWTQDPTEVLAPADVVLEGLSAPEGVWDDGSALWVADTGSDRVLRFPGGATAPDLVLGPAGLSRPSGVAVAGGRVFVTDRGSARVLVWNLAGLTSGAAPVDTITGGLLAPGAVWAGIAPGLGAVAVVADEASGKVSVYDAATLARVRFLSGLGSPAGVSVAGGSLYVAERARNRVAAWSPFPAADDAPATFVIGQPTPAGVRPNEGGIGPGALFLDPADAPGHSARGVAAIDDGAGGVRLFVPDTGNARVLRFGLAP